MYGLVTVDEFCKWRYQGKLKNGMPTKAQQNVVTRMCREGRFVNAFKVGKRWFIDLDAERIANASKKSDAASLHR